LDKNSSLETVFLNQTFEEFSEQCNRHSVKFLILNETKSLNLQMFYSPKNKISAVEITFGDTLNKNSTEFDIELNFFTTIYRNCIIED
jgi:hypothetical protein